jgi:hypothetical protein
MAQPSVASNEQVSAGLDQAAPVSPNCTQADVASSVVEASATGVTPAALSPVTVRDVIEWTSQGVSDDVIIWRIEHSNGVFRLTAANEVQLRDASVSDQVIHAIGAAERRGY